MTDTAPSLYCYVHPKRPTLLRCNNCERPICTSCAVRTPTGYRCRECVRGQQRVFDTALWYDYVIVFFTGALLSAIASLLAYLIASVVWGFFVLFLGPLAGVFMGNVARRLVKNHRSKMLNLLFGVAIVAGALPLMFMFGLGSYFGMVYAGGNMLTGLVGLSPLLWQLLYLVTAVPSAYSQFSGIFFRR